MESGGSLKARVYYRTNPPEVVLQKDGKDVLSYKTVEELVETHIKGLLASPEQDSRIILELRKKYRPSSDHSK